MAQTIEQSLIEMLATPAAKAKLKFPALWKKVKPFLSMITLFVPKLGTYVAAFIQAIDAYIAGAKVNQKLADLWLKLRPYVEMLSTIFGKKVGAYIKAFLVFIDKIVEADTV